MIGNNKNNIGYLSKNMILILFVIAVMAMASSPAQGVEVSASVDSNQVTIHDQVTLTISVEGGKPDYTPSIPLLEDFQEVGSTSAMSSIQIINGRITTTSEYQYTLLPIKAGKLTIPPIEIQVDGKKYTTQLITVDVIKPNIGEHGHPGTGTVDSSPVDEVFMTASTDKKEVFIGEQITYTIALYTRIDLYNLSIVQAPKLTGFWTRDLYTAKKLHFERSQLGDIVYNVATLKIKALFPTSAGELSIDPMILQLEVKDNSAKRRRRNMFNPFDDQFFSRARTKTITRKTDPITIVVKPLPSADKPGDFTGAVGNFTIYADVDKTRVKEDEPITLNLVISGTGNLQTVTMRKLPDLGILEPYDSQSTENITTNGNIVGGKKIYEYVLIPRSPGTSMIPPLSFSFFNPVDGKYHTLQSRSFRINVDENPLKNKFKKSDQGKIVYKEGIKIITQDIRFIKMDAPISGSAKPLFMQSWFIILQFIPLTMLIAAIFLRKHLDKLETDVSYARSRSAKKMARKRLNSALNLLKNGESDSFYSEIHKALSQFIADKCNISSAGITEDMLRDLFTGKGYPVEIIQIIENVFDKCNRARFAPMEMSPDSKQKLYDETSAVIQEIEKYHG